MNFLLNRLKRLGFRFVWGPEDHRYENTVFCLASYGARQNKRFLEEIAPCIRNEDYSKEVRRFLA